MEGFRHTEEKENNHINAKIPPSGGIFSCSDFVLCFAQDFLHIVAHAVQPLRTELLCFCNANQIGKGFHIRLAEIVLPDQAARRGDVGQAFRTAQSLRCAIHPVTEGQPDDADCLQIAF